MHRSPWRPHAAAPAVLIVVALLAGCGSPNSSAPARPTSTPSSSPTSEPGSGRTAEPGESSGRQAVPVYYVVDTRGGTRLYREFQSAPTGDPGTAAVRKLLASDTGADPDYRSTWPPGWSLRSPVEHAGGVVTVDLDPPTATGGGPATDESARLAVQQLVYTVQGALGSTDPVRILLDGRPIERLWGQVPISAPVARANPSATRSLVQIDNPVHGAVLGRTVRVSGEAAVSEANVLWEVLQGQTVVQHGFATAAEAFKFSPYSFTVTLAPGDYTLRVYESDASDGEGRPPFSDTKAITVR